MRQRIRCPRLSKSLCPPPAAAPRAKSAAATAGRRHAAADFDVSGYRRPHTPATVYIRTPGPDRSGQRRHFRNSSGSLQTTTARGPISGTLQEVFRPRREARSLYSCAMRVEPHRAWLDGSRCPAGTHGGVDSSLPGHGTGIVDAHVSVAGVADEGRRRRCRRQGRNRSP